jgi:hypothetical protein
MGRSRAAVLLTPDGGKAESASWDGVMPALSADRLMTVAHRSRSLIILGSLGAVLSGRTYISCRQAEQPVGGRLDLFLCGPGA